MTVRATMTSASRASLSHVGEHFLQRDAEPSTLVVSGNDDAVGRPSAFRCQLLVQGHASRTEPSLHCASHPRASLNRSLRDHFKSGQRRCPELRCSTLSTPVQASLICDGLNLTLNAIG